MYPSDGTWTAGPEKKNRRATMEGPILSRPRISRKGFGAGGKFPRLVLRRPRSPERAPALFGNFRWGVFLFWGPRQHFSLPFRSGPEPGNQRQHGKLAHPTPNKRASLSVFFDGALPHRPFLFFLRLLFPPFALFAQKPIKEAAKSYPHHSHDFFLGHHFPPFAAMLAGNWNLDTPKIGRLVPISQTSRLALQRKLNSAGPTYPTGNFQSLSFFAFDVRSTARGGCACFHRHQDVSSVESVLVFRS